MFWKPKERKQEQIRKQPPPAKSPFKMEGDVLARWTSDEAVCVIPEGIREIGGSAFSSCFDLKEVVFPRGLKKIGSHAFFACTHLESVTLPEGLRFLGDHAFFGCDRLKRVRVPDSVSHIGKGAFASCGVLEELRLSRGQKWPVFQIENGVLTDYIAIRDLESVEVPEGVAEIKKCRLDRSVREIKLPRSLRMIHRCAFDSSFGLERILIPEGVEVIGESAFRNCSALVQAELPPGLRKLEDNVFNGCSALEAITLPGEIRQIGYAAFQKCSSLREVRIPEKVRVIGGYAFRECGNLETAALPEGLEEIDHNAFCKCGKLEEVVCADPEAFEAALADTPFWRVRYGQTERVRLPMNVVGNRSGQWLRERGYSFFKKDRDYHISPPGEDGVVVVSSWCGDDGPDEDGFGREEYYDWWMLDESLEPIPGIRMWHSYSNLDRRSHEAEWNAQRAEAAQKVRQKYGKCVL